MSSSKTNKLNRFTTLPDLLEMLERECLLFSNPKYWEDKNDSEVLEIYKRKKYGNKADAKLFALCFLEDDETIHHWKAYAEGMLGCCIEFDKSATLDVLSKHRRSGISFGPVAYKRLKDLGYGTVDECVQMIPFIKRWPYRVEREFRIVWDGVGDRDCYDIPIEPSKLIRKITLSPDMPESLFSTVRNYLVNKLVKLKFKTPENLDQLINHSKILLDRKRWIDKFEKFGDTPNYPTAN